MFLALGERLSFLTPPLWVLLRDLFHLDLGSVLSGTGSLDDNQPKAGLETQGRETLPSGSASIKTGKSLSLLSQGLGRVEEGRLPVSLQLLLGKNPLPPLPLVLLPLPGGVEVMPASREPSPRRQPLRPSATRTSLHRVRAERAAVIAVPVASAAHFCLLFWLTLLRSGLTIPQCLSH